MTVQTIPPQSAIFSIDPFKAKKLRFVLFGLSVSRAYQFPQRDFARTCDWDFVGMLDRRCDISERNCVAWLGLMAGELPLGDVAQEGQTNTNWEVIRFSSFVHDGSKPSLKLWSEEHIRAISPDPEVSRFGVLSAKTVRSIQNHHPRTGDRLFVYQPLRIMENLCALVDVDFLAGEDDRTALTAGVTCDLFLSSYTLFERSVGVVGSLKGALMRKWRALADAPDMQCLVPLLHGYNAFNTETVRRLHIELIGKTPSHMLVDGLSSSSSSSSPTRSDTDSHGGSSATSQWKDDEDYGIVSFLPIDPNYNAGSVQPERFVSTIPDVHHRGDFEFRPVSAKYYPSSFTSNSEGSFGEIRPRVSTGWSEWKPVFVKKGLYVNDECKAFPGVQEHFPPHCLQHLVAADNDAQMLFYSRFEGRTLGQVRLDYYLEGNKASFRDTVDWFLDVELRRAEHVLDTYSKTLNINTDPTSAPKQSIHRFYHTRLQSGSRFREFYSERCLDVLGIHRPTADFTTNDFLTTPLTINGVAYPPLQQYFDNATDVLDPHKQGRLSDLPVAFGLGDGHAGNLMVTEHLKGSVTKAIYIDYEVSGTHSPFLDIAKSIYNDAFFNALYADLLSDTTTEVSKSNKSGATVSWNIQPHAIDIDYKLHVDTIGRVVAMAKFEYVLLPLFDLVNQEDPVKARHSLDVLSSALFTCALLTRNFKQRPDVFFLNLAVGVRLASERNEILSETFGWHRFPVLRNPTTCFTQDMQLQLVSPAGESQDSSPQWPTDLGMDFITFLLSSNIQPDDVFLKRADDTYKLQQWFSQTDNESEGTIIRRISQARRAGMMISPHTCIRESIFAEPRIDHHFAYSSILAEVVQDPSKLLVDAGCCMGTDIRKLVLDGFPPENILGLDLESRYFDVGRTLYNEDLATTKLRFQQADLVDPSFPSKHAHLHNRFHLVHSANVIHLFGVAEQEIFFRNLIHLVAPGGMIWGRQVGLADDLGVGHHQLEGKGARFTIDEFRKLALRSGGWGETEARYEAQLVKYGEIRAEHQYKAWVLQWSVQVPVEKERGRERGLLRVVEEED